MNNKGFELQFNWIFILIAGALILTFFTTIAYRQRAISNEKLQLMLAGEIENAFTGAILSKGTAQKLPMPAQGIAFECTQGCECRHRIGNAARTFGNKQLFAPTLLTKQEIIAWSLELKMPYRVTNFLYLTNAGIKYYFVYADSGNELLEKITKNIPQLIEYENVTMLNLEELKPEGYLHTRFVFLATQPKLPSNFKKAEVSAVKIDANAVQFYEKQDGKFSSIGNMAHIGLPGIYAAIFSADYQMYECGMKGAFKKLSYLSRLNAERAAELQENPKNEWCTYGAGINDDVCENAEGVVANLCEQSRDAKSLADELNQSKIENINRLTQELEERNVGYLKQSCPELF